MNLEESYLENLTKYPEAIHSIGAWEVEVCCAACKSPLPLVLNCLDNHSEKTDSPKVFLHDEHESDELVDYLSGRECPECKAPCSKISYVTEIAPKGKKFKSSGIYGETYKRKTEVTNIFPLPTVKRRFRKIIISPEIDEWVKINWWKTKKISHAEKSFTQWEDINE